MVSHLTLNIGPDYIISYLYEVFSLQPKNASIHVNNMTCQVKLTVTERLMGRVLGEAAGVNQCF